jgi:hypothetical protein
MVEHEDEIGLDERGGRDAHRVALRQRDGRLEDRHRIVGERTHCPAGEPRHAGRRHDAPPWHEAADRVERIRGFGDVERQIRCVLRHRDRPGLRSSDAVADLEEPPRADTKERVASQPLPALDRLEEVRRPTVVEAEEGADGRLEVGRAGGAEQDRVRVRREALRLGQAERIVRRHVGGLHAARPRRESNTTSRPGTKGRAFRGATLIRRCRTRDRRAFDGISVADRSALPCIAGALRRSLLVAAVAAPFGPEAPGSIHRRRRPGFHQPPGLSADVRRVLVPFTARSS